MTDQASAAQAMIKAVYDDGKADIGENSYVFTNMTHKNRRAVFAFYTGCTKQIQSGDFGFMDTPEFDRIEKIISDHVTVDDSLLSKKSTHWEQYPGEYVLFIQTAMPVISYPFLAGSRTG